MTGRVSGKVAIVTGAARGMGAAFARRLLEEGAKVMLTDISENEPAGTNDYPGHARFLRHDVMQEAQWREVVSVTESEFGPISILVNNAGIVSAGAIETLEEKDYRHVIDTNQVSVFLGMKAIVPAMKRTGSGSIINISSTAGIQGSAQMLAYCASKFAVRGMTKVAALELAPHNIRVNSIHPGLIRTPMTVATPQTAEPLELAAQTTPACRLGEPEEVANIVVLLASDESRFATGAEFVIDGGLTCQ